MPSKQNTSPASAGTHPTDGPQFVIVTPGEAALLAAHRKEAGTKPPTLEDMETCHRLFNFMMDSYREGVVNIMLTQATGRVALVVADRMVRLQESA